MMLLYIKKTVSKSLKYLFINKYILNFYLLSFLYTPIMASYYLDVAIIH